MKKFLILVSIAGLLFAEPFNIGTGGEKGNYFSMANDIKEYCKSVVPDMQVQKSDGSIDNLSGMTNKVFQAGIIQSDVLMNMAKTTPRDINMQNMKIIAGLHIETIHLLSPKDYKPKGSGVFNKFFGSDKEVTGIQDLQGIEVSSYGGSLVSANALNYFFNLNWTIHSVTADKIGSVNTPILLVGGVPYKPVEELLKTGKWKLIPINYDSVKASAPFYIKSDITYTVNSAPISVQTIGVQAMLVGKAYRNADKNTIMEKLASCVEKSVPDMADDSKTNPNWVSVYENQKLGNLVNWTFFNMK